MGKFLNTEAIITEFKKILDRAKFEVVIITPYLNLSESLICKFLELNNKGVEILLIHRDDKLDEGTKQKIRSIPNLTTMHHPTLHAKCYFNENRMIISSFNLLEYSEKNNREMGVLLICEGEGEDDVFSLDDFQIFDDCLIEVKKIVKSSDIIQRSNKIKDEFSYIFLKDNQTLLHEIAININKQFENKTFEPSNTEYFESCVECTNYHNRVKELLQIEIYNVSSNSYNWKITRALLFLSHPVKQLDVLRSEFITNYSNYKLKIDFKYYWNKPEKPIYIYPSREFNTVNPDTIKLFKGEIENIIRFFKLHKIFQKIY
jgi:hypothetical protein